MTLSSELTRDRVLAVLHSMGVNLPSNTKIPKEDLIKRLSQALDAAQRYRDVIGSPNFNTNTAASWPSDKNLRDATHRSTFWELARDEAYATGRNIPPESPKKDIFTEMRQIFNEIARGFHIGVRSTFIIGTEGAVFVRIINVYSVKDTPVFLVGFREVDGEEAPPIQRKLTELALPKATKPSDYQMLALRTDEHQRLSILMLLDMNSKRLSAVDDIPLDESKIAEAINLKLSFLLPLAPLSLTDIGRLMNKSGCEVCGKKTASRCLQCLSVVYCGPGSSSPFPHLSYHPQAHHCLPKNLECQKADWPNHKATCRSLNGGTWSTITCEIIPHIPGISLQNHHETPQDARKRDKKLSSSVAGGRPPPDIHHGKAFLLKFQISLFRISDDTHHMLLYDRQRSFQVMWMRNSARDLFDRAEHEMGDVLKIYRWARRVGDYQFEVCFDRPPATNPPW
ncbi:hypothetical protein D9613_007244 [Agrocybe pediades]|uniref:MYND-type domain-containing protein n=1 Tax=Agrocybe pediades TaxID=84607 RepID=A0A8H4VIT3_9AGAR|nr:hypothetical protein D9613_007244 [Agrocybe pediades]